MVKAVLCQLQDIPPANTFLLELYIIYNCTDVVELDYMYCICFRKSFPTPVNMPPIYLTSP